MRSDFWFPAIGHRNLSTSEDSQTRASQKSQRKLAVVGGPANSEWDSAKFPPSKKHLLQLTTSHKGLSRKQVSQKPQHIRPSCWLPFSAAYKIQTLSRKSSLQIEKGGSNVDIAQNFLLSKWHKWFWRSRLEAEHFCSSCCLDFAANETQLLSRELSFLIVWLAMAHRGNLVKSITNKFDYSAPTGGRMHLVFIDNFLDNLCMSALWWSEAPMEELHWRGSDMVPSSAGTDHNLSVLQRPPSSKGVRKKQVCWKGEHVRPSLRLFVLEWSPNTFKRVLVSSWCWVAVALEHEDFQTRSVLYRQFATSKIVFWFSMKSGTAECRATAPTYAIGWTASQSHLLQLTTSRNGLSRKQVCQNAMHLQFCWMPFGANEIWTHSKKSYFFKIWLQLAMAGARTSETFKLGQVKRIMTCQWRDLPVDHSGHSGVSGSCSKGATGWRYWIKVLS